MANETNYDSIFGKIVLEKGLCTSDELKRALEQLKSDGQISPNTLHEIVIELGFITSTQADRVHSEIKNIKESKAAAHQIPGYEIKGKLGAGAMAVVYLAKQISLDRDVAIKVLPKRFTQNPEYVERFYKEGKAAGKLNHPNIVQAVDVGEAGGYHYFVMEYVEGKSIYDDLAAGKVYDEAEALDIVIQVARALKHAHSVNLIHRDVKPKNIMLTNEGIVKLADMGLARETSDTELAEAEKGKAYGTPYYIAPEQIRGEMDIDGRADIYGLGATLYHMITGRVPFMAEDPSVVMKKHLREELIPPDHINTALTAGISEVVEVMMAKNKENRYENCKELLEDLETIRQGEAPIRARRKFDVSALKGLSEGEDIDSEYEEYIEYEQEDALVKYKVITIAMGAALAISVVIIILLLVR